MPKAAAPETAPPENDPAASSARTRHLAAKALPEHNRRHNRAALLQRLFHLGPLSRADLARETGLTRVTISDLVSSLEADGLLRELGRREPSAARVGKPATLVDIAADAATIAAIDLSPDDAFAGALFDLRGRLIQRFSKPLDGATGEAAIERVLLLVAALIDAAPSPIIGIGVGTPGIVDPDGIVSEAPNLGWQHVDLGARIRRAFDYPVHVANDANAAALGVRTFGETTGDSLMVIRVEHGVGAGLVIGGRLVHGEQSAAGEIGHVVVDADGEQCACGQRGCLEPILAAPQLRRRLAAAPAGDRERILADAGRALGVTLSPVLGILNVNLVVLSGPAELLEGTLIESARRTIRARTLSAVSNGLDLRAATGDEDLVLVGGACLVLEGQLGVS